MTTEAKVLEAQGTIRELVLDTIVPNPFQPRTHFDEDKIKELAAAIKQHGLQQPIVVRMHPTDEGKFQIVMGERRWRAHKLLERPTVQAIVREYADDDIHELALVENMQRDDLTIMEEARSLLGLVERHGTLQTVADRISKSITFVTRRLALLQLSQEIQAMIDEGTVLPAHADVILDIEGAENQLKAAEMVVKLNLTADKLHGRMLRHMKPKESENGTSAGVVKYGHISGGLARLYDSLEGFEYSKLRDTNKRDTLKRQMGLVQQAIGMALEKLELPVEEGGEASEEESGEQ